MLIRYAYLIMVISFVCLDASGVSPYEVERMETLLDEIQQLRPLNRDAGGSRVSHVIGDLEMSADTTDGVVALPCLSSTGLGIKVHHTLEVAGGGIGVGSVCALSRSGVGHPQCDQVVIGVQKGTVRRYHPLPFKWGRVSVSAQGSFCYVMGPVDREDRSAFSICRTSVVDGDGEIAKDLTWERYRSIEAAINAWLTDKGYRYVDVPTYHVSTIRDRLVVRILGAGEDGVALGCFAEDGELIEERVIPDVDSSRLWGVSTRKGHGEVPDTVFLPVKGKGSRIMAWDNAGHLFMGDTPDIVWGEGKSINKIGDSYVVSSRRPTHGLDPVLVELVRADKPSPVLPRITSAIASNLRGFLPSRLRINQVGKLEVEVMSPMRMELGLVLLPKTPKDPLLYEKSVNRKERGLSEGRHISHFRFDHRGVSVPGTMSIPVNYLRPGPCVMYVHGGPVDTSDDNERIQLLNNVGIAVVTVDYPGSSSTPEIYHAGKGITLDGQLDVIHEVAKACVANGLADPDRLGLMGYSWGGLLANREISNNRGFFRAVNSAAGPSRLDILDAEQTLGDHMLLQIDPALIPKSRHDRRERLYELSPASHLLRGKGEATARLLIHGAADRCVLPFHTQLMHEALHQNSMDHTCAFVAGAAHDFRESPAAHITMELLQVGFFWEELGAHDQRAEAFGLLKQLFLPRSLMMGDAVNVTFDGADSPMLREVLALQKRVMHPDLVSLHLMPKSSHQRR